MNKVHELLKSEQLAIDDDIDYCAVIYNDKNEIIATISKYCNTIRYLVISFEYQGFNLMNKLVSYITNIIYQEGFNEVFVFTKPGYLSHFQQLGFKLLYGNDNFVFLTNRWDLFKQYIYCLNNQNQNNKDASVIILNANPFTKGHQYLVKTASENSGVVYLMLVKEEDSLFSYQQRKIMVQEGIAAFKNVILLDGSNYLISKSTFSSYFLPSLETTIIQQAILDANIFALYVCPTLNIKKRFVGSESFSKTTNQYNQILKQELKKQRIELMVIPRLKYEDISVSATTVRKLFIVGEFEK